MLNYALYNQAQYGQGNVNPSQLGSGIQQQTNALGPLSPSTLGVNFAQLQNQSNIYGVNNFGQDPRLNANHIRMMQV